LVARGVLSEGPGRLADMAATMIDDRVAEPSGLPRRSPQGLRVDQPNAGSPVPVALPVASVLLDVPLAHLDRPFDYAVPSELAAIAQPGVRVRVRFAGTKVGGYVVARSAGSAHPGRLSPLLTVVSAEPILTTGLVRLARQVADRYGGTMADVLRLAVPPRHARVEAEPGTTVPSDAAAGTTVPSDAAAGTTVPSDAAAGTTVPSDAAAVTTVPSVWEQYLAGPALVSRLRAGEQPRAAVAALPGQGPALVAGAVAATVAAGRGALVVVPDARDLAVFAAALGDALGPGFVSCLSADLGPAARYRTWLGIRRGRARVVVGTRAAVFAPVADLGLLACWDDGDDLLAEPRAPYPHAREILVRRAVEESAGLLLAGHVVTPESAALSRDGFLAVLSASRERTRSVAPRVLVSGDEREMSRDPAARAARLPAVVLRTVRAALARGPVLVQVPRGGYLPVLACGGCRAAASCPHCDGPLAMPGSGAVASCRWCGRPAVGWRCPECGSARMRSRRVGAARTAEELGRAFPGVAVLQSASADTTGEPNTTGGPGGVPAAAPDRTGPASRTGPAARPATRRARTSGGGWSGVRATVPQAPALVIATPGAEPLVTGGYAAVILLDGDTLLARTELAAGQEALRRWMNAAALVRAGSLGQPAGTVVVVADAGHRPVQALVRWDPVGAAEQELDERVATSLPPATVVVEVVGDRSDVADLLARCAFPGTAQVLGPVPVPDGEPDLVRALVRDRRGRGSAVVGSLRSGQAARTARKLPHVRLRVDPVDLG